MAPPTIQELRDAGKLEPEKIGNSDINSSQGRILLSQAISLKRIADAAVERNFLLNELLQHLRIHQQ